MHKSMKILAAAAVVYVIVAAAYLHRRMKRVSPDAHMLHFHGGGHGGGRGGGRGAGRGARWGGRGAGHGSWHWTPNSGAGSGPFGRRGGMMHSPAWWYVGWGDWPGWDAAPSWRWSYEYPLFYQWLAATYPALVESIRARKTGAVSMADLKPYLCRRAGLAPSACD